jgi:pSer/pThr/pTyr-binding forkhead associated (FHA) protein
VATLTDLGSTNGTYVDGDLTRSVSLQNGAALTLGRTRATYRSGER